MIRKMVSPQYSKGSVAMSDQTDDVSKPIPEFCSFHLPWVVPPVHALYVLCRGGSRVWKEGGHLAEKKLKSKFVKKKKKKKGHNNNS